MPSSGLEILAPDPRLHAEAMYELIDLEWPGTGDGCRDGRIAHSHYDWQASRIGVLDGRVVTHLGVYDILMRVGTARVRTGGVNLVVTHPEHRGSGLMTETIQAALGAMRDLGYDLSVLCNATEGYYGRFGYVPAWPEIEYAIKTSDMPREAPAMELQPFTPGHRDELAALYNRENETLTGTAVRPTYRRTKAPGNYQGRLWTGDSGRVEGYVVYGANARRGWLWHDDSAGDPEQRLRALGALAREHACPEVRFERLPHDGPLCRRLRALNCTAETRYSETGGWMVRIVNLRSLLGKLVGELSLRLVRSHLAGWRGDLLVATREEEALLGIERGRVRLLDRGGSPHAICRGAGFARLVVGSASPAETIESSGIEMSGDAYELVEVLFPRRDPQMGGADL